MPSLNEVSKIIAILNPDRYSENPSEIKKTLKTEGYRAALEKAKPLAAEDHKLVYDSTSETLEPVYFWILDKITEDLAAPEKLVDNFTSSPGSGHFSELMGKATRMQEEAMKIMQTIGVLIKSMVNLVYDLKEFEIRLSQYKYANSKDKEEAQAGLLALKQIWMDNVDMKRGAGSINALTTGNLNFVTLRDSFMAANSLQAVKDLDLNDRVKRILEARLTEFLKWRELSEKELRKRYSIEKTYLKSQLNSLKLYARWAKPYLKAATQLEQSGSKDPGLVTAFNTIILEVVLFSKKEFDYKNAAQNKDLPESFANIKLKRNYNICVLMEIYFRGIPQRVGQNYVFGGRAEVTFRGYSLNDEEIKTTKKLLEKNDIEEAMKLVSGMTDDSIKVLQEDIDYFLKEEEEREQEEKVSQNTNPFSALFGFGKKKPENKQDKKEPELTPEQMINEIKPDKYMEKVIRSLAERTARKRCFDVFDIYKKGHGMASHPLVDMYEPEDVETWKGAERWFGIKKP